MITVHACSLVVGAAARIAPRGLGGPATWVESLGGFPPPVKREVWGAARIPNGGTMKIDIRVDTRICIYFIVLKAQSLHTLNQHLKFEGSTVLLCL